MPITHIIDTCDVYPNILNNKAEEHDTSFLESIG